MYLCNTIIRAHSNALNIIKQCRKTSQTSYQQSLYASYPRPDHPVPPDPPIYPYIGAPKSYLKHRNRKTVPCLLK